MTRKRVITLIAVCVAAGFAPCTWGQSENFETVPAWSSFFDAAWGNAATFSSVAGGQTGNFLQGSRTGPGSSARVQVFSVPQNTNLTISIYMRCPSSTNYWMETGFKLGNNTAQNFDTDSATWTLIKKFDASGTFENGNNNTWTQYTAQVNSGSNTQITIGYKLGTGTGAGPVVGWDTLVISGAAQPTNTPTATSPGAPTSTPTNTVPGGCPVTECFETLPVWASSYDAPWGSAAVFSVQAGGQAGNALQTTRASQGSSVRAQVFSVPQNTNVTITIYMRCPSSTGYWMETGFKLGNNTAQNFDEQPGTWTLIQKFDDSGSYPNGNNNTWTQYTAQVNTGTNTQITVGYKAGSYPGAGPAMGWDTLNITGAAGPTNTPTNTVPGQPTNTPTTPPGGCAVTECFETMPSWTSTFDAAWGSAAAFSIQAGGQDRNFLQAVRASAGSSARVIVYTVPQNTNLTLSIYMRCPSSAAQYWMETGYKLGASTASSFDQEPATWTLIKKFDGFGTFENGNNNTWTQYTAQVNTGQATELSIGIKSGVVGGAGPTVGWDTFNIGGLTPPATATPTATNTSVAPTATPTNTVPVGPDTDGDNIPDSLEGFPPVAGQSHGWLDDSDGDGLSDGTEDANRNGTQDPGETSTRDSDSDDDRYEDGLEVRNGTNPLSASSPGTPYVDLDSDLYPASQDPNDNNKDVDGDLYLDGYEFQKIGAPAVTNNSIRPRLGDLDLNNFVTNVDALIAQALFLGVIDISNPVLQGQGFKHGDADRNGLYSNLDALVLQAVFLGVFDRLPL